MLSRPGVGRWPRGAGGHLANLRYLEKKNKHGVWQKRFFWMQNKYLNYAKQVWRWELWRAGVRVVMLGGSDAWKGWCWWWWELVTAGSERWWW